MKTLKNFALIAALSITLLPVMSEAKVGEVAFVTGAASLDVAPGTPLKRKDPVDNGNTVITGDDGRVQLKMMDGAKVAIRPGSRFTIKDYQVTASALDTSVAVSSSAGRENAAVLELLKGGFRTITGNASREQPEDYQVVTPVATLGIRGTHYQVRICDNSCAESLPARLKNGYKGAGLYVGVYEGRVWIKTEKGLRDFNAGEFAYVGDKDSLPQRLIIEPGVLLESMPPPRERRDNNRSQPRVRYEPGNTRRAPQKERQPRSLAQAPGNGDLPDPDRRLNDDNGGQLVGSQTPDPLQRSISWGLGPVDVNGKPTETNSADNVDDGSFLADAGGQLEAFSGQLGSPNGGSDSVRYEIGSSTQSNPGSDAQTGLQWGRWEDGSANLVLNGSDNAQNFSGSESLHWIAGPLTNQAPAIPVTGTASYSVIGNTNPTDNVSTVGFLGGATLQADFGAQTLSSTVNLGIGGENWQAAGTTTLNSASPHLFSGNYNTVTVNGNAAGEGQFSGFLLAVDPAVDPDRPVGAGLSYSLHDPQNARGSTPGVTGGGGPVTVSGTVAFGQPAP